MIYIDDEDKPVFDYLSAIRVERNEKDVREASIHLDFEPNDYFNNSTLTRSFKLKEGAGSLGAEFDFPEHMKSEPFVIEWKSDEKNQAKLRPTQFSEDEEDFEPGSFFSSFFDSKHENLVVSNLEFKRRPEMYSTSADAIFLLSIRFLLEMSSSMTFTLEPSIIILARLHCKSDPLAQIEVHSVFTYLSRNFFLCTETTFSWTETKKTMMMRRRMKKTKATMIARLILKRKREDQRRRPRIR